MSTLLLRRIVLVEGLTEELAGISVRTDTCVGRWAGALWGGFNGRFDFSDSLRGLGPLLIAKGGSGWNAWWRRRRFRETLDMDGGES